MNLLNNCKGEDQEHKINVKQLKQQLQEAKIAHTKFNMVF